jgi:hypothetical protein
MANFVSGGGVSTKQNAGASELQPRIAGARCRIPDAGTRPRRVRTVVRAQASYPSSEESDLILWRPEHEQADRPEIVSAVASFVDGLKQS